MKQNDAGHANRYHDRSYHSLAGGSFDQINEQYQQALAQASPEQYKKLVRSLERSIKKHCNELEKAQQWDKAVEIFAYLSSTLLPGSKQMRRWWADSWMHRGHAERKAGNPQKARAAYKRALEIDPGPSRRVAVRSRTLAWWVWVAALTAMLLPCLLISAMLRPYKAARKTALTQTVASTLDIASLPTATRQDTSAPTSTPTLEPLLTTTPEQPPAATPTSTLAPTQTPSNTPMVDQPSTPTVAATPTTEPTPTVVTATPTKTATPLPAVEVTPQAGNQIPWEQDQSVLVYVPGDVENILPFWMDLAPVTNAQFQVFTEQENHTTRAELLGHGWVWNPDRFDRITNYSWRRPWGARTPDSGLEQHPVVYVTLRDAQSYCSWAGKRLPSRTEWQLAAKGTDERTYPWGDQAPSSTYLNYCDIRCQWTVTQDDDGYNRTSPVCAFPAGNSPYGLCDMAGNVWEWTSDWNLREQKQIICGGAWAHPSRDAAICADGEPQTPINVIGFRCVRDADFDIVQRGDSFFPAN